MWRKATWLGIVLCVLVGIVGTMVVGCGDGDSKAKPDAADEDPGATLGGAGMPDASPGEPAAAEE